MCLPPKHGAENEKQNLCQAKDRPFLSGIVLGFLSLCLWKDESSGKKYLQLRLNYAFRLLSSAFLTYHFSLENKYSTRWVCYPSGNVLGSEPRALQSQDCTAQLCGLLYLSYFVLELYPCPLQGKQAPLNRLFEV